MNRITRSILCAFFILSLTAGCASAQRGAMLRARSGIEKQKYSFALRRLTDAESYTQPTPQLKAEILYLKGVCHLGLKQNAEANALFNHLIEKFGETEYAALAKAQLAKNGFPPAK